MNEPDEANFAENILTQLGADDEQELLIILDYLISDYVNHEHSMTSTELKSGISVYNLTESVEMSDLIEQTASALMSITNK